MSECIGAYPLARAWGNHATVTFAIASWGAWQALFDPAAPLAASPLGRALHEMGHALPPDEATALLPALAFAANELVENALRFNEAGSVTLTSGVSDAGGFCLVSNQLRTERVPALRLRLHALLQGDPGDLLRQQVEDTFGIPASGLGYLTLRHDYGAHLGWGIEPYSPQLVQLRALAYLPPTKGTTDGN